MVRSRLRYRGQQEIILHDGNGGRARLIARDVLEGYCRRCDKTFWVTSRIGDMKCPHCGAGEIEWAWGQVGTAFIPERGGQFVGPPDNTADPKADPKKKP